MKKTYRVFSYIMYNFHGFATCTPTDKRTKTGKRIWIEDKTEREYILERFADGKLAFHACAADFD